MQHTLVAVFDNRGDAQRALEDLVASGFARQSVRLSDGDPAGEARAQSRSKPADDSIGASIKHFFTDIFGTDRSLDARMYSEAVTRGHHVLTLSADSEPDVERAADIVERHGPIDIDEHAQQWRAGALQQSPAMSQQGATSQGGQYQGAQQRAETHAIPVIEEELKVGKREVQRGGVRIFQRVVETPVSRTVGLREEHVNVERHAVDRPLGPADADAFQESTIEVRESAEEAVIEKTARVVEEVVVGKNVTEREESISATVRRTEVDVEPLSLEDDAWFRGHWSSNYANTGGSYEQFAPAYIYGSSMARSGPYRGRSWSEAEASLRSDWESRHAPSTWETMKAAIRHGWERITRGRHGQS
jgi:uncharacterized protein (TIGR02271 family)